MREEALPAPVDGPATDRKWQCGLEPNHAIIIFFLCRDEKAQHLYYLQLKENFLSYNFSYPEERCFLLASYSLHGDHVTSQEFDPRQYFPAWVSVYSRATAGPITVPR